MENVQEKGSEQSSNRDTVLESPRVDVNDLKIVRQMAAGAASSADKLLPVLSLEGPPEKKAVKGTNDEYKAQELRRAEDYANKNKDGTPLDRTVLAISTLPERMSIAAKPGQLKIESSGFARIAEAIPNAKLDQTFRTMLDGLKSAAIDGKHVQADLNVKAPIEVLPGVTAELTLKNPGFDIVPDKQNPGRLNLENITGISIAKLGVGGDIKKASFTLGKDGNGQPTLQIEIPRPEQKIDAKPTDLLHRFGQNLSSAVGSVLPEVIKITVPLNTPEGAEVVQRVFDNVKNFVTAPEKNNPADLAAGIAGVDLKTVIGGMLDGIKSVSKDGDRLQIEREKATTHELGGLPVQLSELVKAKIEASGKSVNLSQIEGVSLNLPLPEQVAKAAGLPFPVKANLKEASISEPDKNGQRTLTVKTDSVLESVQIKVGADMQPILDAKGRMSIDISVKNKDVSLPLTVAFNPKQLENPPANGPDFTISMKGDSNYVKLIESMSGAKIDSPLKEMVTGVTSISKEGDRIQITRDKASSHDLGGVVLDAGKNIRFKVAQDGPSGAKLSNIEGINLKLPVELPGIVKDLGIDPGKEIITSLKTLGLSSPDAAGRRKVLLETDHLLRQVGVMLGPDMKPALDPKGNWYLYGLVDNPVANQKMPLVLRMDKDNHLAMTTQELMRIGSLAAWQGTDNGGVEGVGFGMIAVATEVGATALDIKDAVVDTAIVVKDKVVDGAIAVKDFAVDAAVVTGGAIVDAGGAVIHAGGRAARWIGSWFD